MLDDVFAKNLEGLVLKDLQVRTLRFIKPSGSVMRTENNPNRIVGESLLYQWNIGHKPHKSHNHANIHQEGILNLQTL